MVNLETLNLRINQLAGVVIPVELGQLANLKELYLNDNQLTCVIAVELGQLVNLELLNLMDNQLAGALGLLDQERRRHAATTVPPYTLPRTDPSLSSLLPADTIHLPPPSTGLVSHPFLPAALPFVVLRVVSLCVSHDTAMTHEIVVRKLDSHFGVARGA